MNAWALVAIFSKLTLNNAYKTVASYFVFQAREEDEIVATHDTPVWIFARGSTNIDYFLYNICLYIIYQMHWVAQLASVDGIDVQDLGSNPRSV